MSGGIPGRISAGARLGSARWVAETIEFAGGRKLRGCTQDAWNYEISGRAALPHYLANREHWDAQSAPLLREIRLVVSAVVIMSEMSVELDDFLTDVLTSSLHKL